MRGRGMLADRLTDQSICPALENDHRMRAAAIQMNSTGDRPRNLATAERLVRAAAARRRDARRAAGEVERARHARAARGRRRAARRARRSTWARELARELRIDLSPARSSSGRRRGARTGKRFNTSVHVGPDGELRAVYRKLHLFDVEVAGTVYRESDGEDPGEEIVTTTLARRHRARHGRSATTCASPSCSAILRCAARACSRCRPPSRSRPRATTGRCCCAPARSRTSASSSPPTRSASTRPARRPAGAR